MTADGLGADDLAFRARALAQAHPMTPVAAALRTKLVKRERLDQPMPELAEAASNALLVGYCVRQVEEAEVAVRDPVGRDSNSARPDSDSAGDGIRLDEIDRAATAISAALRAGEPVTLLDDAVTVAALDRVIASEIDKRTEHWRPEVDDAEWSRFEEYIAWWVIHGYAMRGAERAAERAPVSARADA